MLQYDSLIPPSTYTHSTTITILTASATHYKRTICLLPLFFSFTIRVDLNRLALGANVDGIESFTNPSYRHAML